MLLSLLLAGAIDVAAPDPVAGTGAVLLASASRTIAPVATRGATLVGPSIPLGALIWPEPFDPGNRRAYAIDFSGLLADDEKIGDIELIRMPSQATGLGVTVDISTGRIPSITEDGKHVQFWPVVDSGSELNSSFDAGGVMMPVTIRATTDSTPPGSVTETGVLVMRRL